MEWQNFIQSLHLCIAQICQACKTIQYGCRTQTYTMTDKKQNHS